MYLQRIGWTLVLGGLAVLAVRFVAASGEQPRPTASGLFATRQATGHAQPTQLAAFAAGCFWGVEQEFRMQKGVVATAVGFMGGHTEHPTYAQVCTDMTGHAETVEVEYDPALVSYDELLDLFWSIHDPTTPDRQGPDHGSQYRSVIFYFTEDQKARAEASRKRLASSGELAAPVVTEIVPAATFTKAEAYHQQYVEKGGSAACHRRTKSVTAWTGDGFKKPADETLRAKLDLLQYNVTQKEGTEPPFHNAYWDNHRDGIYVDVVSGEPLFSSRDKFDSGTGWPSFTKPIDPKHIATQDDRSLTMSRTEVRSKLANSHLGHVFADGPAPTGMRYCMNSAALRFIPVENLDKEGYGELARLFTSKQ
ncbi:MAG TPA: peptide-methionine (R)-S-oxide reductase MsrB [Candidatus Polarisedimenticolaceae bacterium]|nr:peptide-methionine (R)-S-oxide reductase MsrB [Candidatus Polarisedimenticolaceae bacterium]